MTFGTPFIDRALIVMGMEHATSNRHANDLIQAMKGRFPVHLRRRDTSSFYFLRPVRKEILYKDFIRFKFELEYLGGKALSQLIDPTSDSNKPKRKLSAQSVIHQSHVLYNLIDSVAKAWLKAIKHPAHSYGNIDWNVSAPIFLRHLEVANDFRSPSKRDLSALNKNARLIRPIGHIIQVYEGQAFSISNERVRGLKKNSDRFSFYKHEEGFRAETQWRDLNSPIADLEKVHQSILKQHIFFLRQLGLKGHERAGNEAHQGFPSTLRLSDIIFLGKVVESNDFSLLKRIPAYRKRFLIRTELAHVMRSKSLVFNRVFLQRCLKIKNIVDSARLP